MMNPEGYRKALRLFRLAEKFHLPVVTLIDTPGAFPGLEAEERGQGAAIARNLIEMAALRTPMINVVIGEGASGGALGIGMGDRFMMMENTWYSVIAPESCSSILWRSWDYKEQAAEALRLTAWDLKDAGICDEILPEPVGGAHRDHAAAAETVKSAIVRSLSELMTIPVDALLQRRHARYLAIGVWETMTEEEAPAEAEA
jgi:acetyl-CoA carboxylase carboxyl transferase subunit alpha